MMSPELLHYLVIALLLLVVFNLWLSFRLYARLHALQGEDELPPLLPAGAAMPYINGHFLADGSEYHSNQRDVAASVVVFLSARCADCRKKIPELVHILPAIHEAGIDLLVVGMEKAPQMREFLAGTPLFPHALMLDRVAKKSLNPRNATPFYLFVDHAGIVQATNFIGDEDWLAFMQQMEEILAQLGEAQDQTA